MSGIRQISKVIESAQQLDSFVNPPVETAQNDAITRAHQLEQRLDRLSLVCEALWTMLRDYNNFTDDELRERINLIDLADGKLDGKKSASGPNSCPKCSRAVSPRFNKCIYCSAPIQRDPFA